MRRSPLILATPAAFLLLASGSHAATILCSAVNGNSLSSIAMSGSCSIGDLTYSDFVYQFAPTSGSPATPNPSTDVTVDFTEITDNITSDPFGTVGTATDPLYQIIFNFSDGNTVGENQSMLLTLQYLVTNTNTATHVIQVDNNIVGGADVFFGSSGGLIAKSMCDGGPFTASAGTPTGACSTGAGNVYTSVAPDGGSQFAGNPDSLADSSIIYNGPGQKFGGLIGSANFGVFDQASIAGGASSPLGFATVTEIENDFVQSTPTPIPEPSGFWSLAAGLTLLLLGRARNMRT